MKMKPVSRPKSSKLIRIKSSDLIRRTLILAVGFILVIALLAGGNFLLSSGAAGANDSSDQRSGGQSRVIELSGSKELTEECLILAAQMQPQTPVPVPAPAPAPTQINIPVETQTSLALALALETEAGLSTEAQLPAPSSLPARVQPQSKAKTPVRTQDTWISGVWMHPGMFGPKQDEAVAKMRAVLDDYARAGINTLIMLVKDTSGYVYYQSALGVKDPAYDWDFFGVFLSEARLRNMVVHPWFCVFPEGALVGQVRQHPEWLIVGPGREMVRTVNPALPEVRAYEISLMTELVKKYGVDWVHLDYIRFPCEPTEPYFSHDPMTLKLFKDETGIDFSSLKARDSGNPHWNAWLEWNRQQVTRFVKELKDQLTATGRQVKISAAVFPDADNARVLIGQDWASWAEQGLIDMLCPMLYTNDTALFDRLTKRAVGAVAKGVAVAVAKGVAVAKPAAEARLETPQGKISRTGSGREAESLGKTMICPGIGIGTSHNQSTPDLMLEEIRLARAAGADGVVFFSGSSLTAPFLDRLKN